MTITDPAVPAPIPPYQPGYQPYSNITPFTYRDGITFLQKFESFQAYINNVIVPFINDNFAMLGDEFANQVNILIETVNTALAEQDAEVDQKLQDLKDYVDSVIQTVIDNGVELQDPVMAGIISDPNSQSSNALEFLYVAYANKPDGSIDFATLQAALDAAAISGHKVNAYGAITTNQTLNIKCDCDLGALTINYNGVGIAVQVGSGAAVILYGKSIVTPRVVNANKTVVGWGQVLGTIGVRLVNCNSCKIFVPFVRNFQTGLDNRGEGTGHVYNTITLGQIYNDYIGVNFLSDATGWANQNTFLGGACQIESAEGNRIAGTRAAMFNSSASLPNTNTFVGTSFEGNGWEYVFEMFGLYNVFYDCRYEASLGARCWFRNGSSKNVIHAGYGTLTPTFESATGSAQIIDTPNYHRRIVTTTTNIVLENGSSSANAVINVLDAGGSAAGVDPTTAYDWMLSALLLRGKRSTDAFDRVQLNPSAGSFLLGNGVAAPVAGLDGFTTFLRILSGVTAFWPSVDNAVDLGGTANHFKDAYFSGVLKLANTTTAARPTAASASNSGTGMMFDTTLGIPIFAVGGVWKNAAGVTV